MRIYSEIRIQIKSFKEVLSSLLNNVTKKTNIVLGEKATIGYDDKILSGMKYEIPELKKDALENKKGKKVKEKEKEDEASSTLAKLENIRNNGGFFKKFSMNKDKFSFLKNSKLGKLFKI